MGYGGAAMAGMMATGAGTMLGTQSAKQVTAGVLKNALFAGSYAAIDNMAHQTLDGRKLREVDYGSVITSAEIAACFSLAVSVVVGGVQNMRLRKAQKAQKAQAGKITEYAHWENPYRIDDNEWNRETYGKSSGILLNSRKYINGKYTGGRTEEEIELLASDPAHGYIIQPQGIKEREVGLALEERGDLGHISRDMDIDKAAEFIDETTGIKWDVKSFESYPKGKNGVPITSPKKGAFLVENAIKNIEKEFSHGHNVIIDIRNMVQEHVLQLKKAIEELGYSDRIIWYP